MLKPLRSVGTLLFLASMYGGVANAIPVESVAGVENIQQNETATGVVKDALGETVIGASVVVKGTTNGTITDFDGNFAISNVKKGDIIVVSFVGYKTAEIAWNGAPLDIVLKDDTQALEEVVVVGYGTQKKVNVTGAVSMVGTEAIESRPVANVTQALQGAVPGLNLSTTNSGGMLDGGMSINIRGTGSIGNGSVDSPLVLIDGIEGDMNSLNPNDIESVSVLKDAASASIYGSRAAFGVIMITTKSGKAGKVKVNYSGDVRFSTATHLPDMANSLNFATYFNAANINAGGSAIFNDETMERIKNYLAGKYTDPSQPEYYGTTPNYDNGKWNNYGSAHANTDWFKEHYKENVPSTQHNLSLSGGNEKVNWMLSGSFLMNNGLIRHGKDQLNRYTFNSKIGAELADWIRVEYATKWTRKDYEKPMYLTKAYFFHNIARRWPTCPVVDPNGRWMAEMEIYELEDGGIRESVNDEFTQQLKFIINPLEGWNIYLEGAMRNSNYNEKEEVIPIYNYNIYDEPMLRNSDYGTRQYVTNWRGRGEYYSINAYTDYTRSFGKHNGKVLIGMNYEHYNSDSMTGRGYDLTTTDKGYLSQTLADHIATDSYWHRATAGYFGRLNYDYDGKYLAEFNIRYDGSSRFLADKRWAWFPSVSLGWNIAREEFFEKLSETIGTLKLRGSWGQLGNTSSKYESFSDWYPFYQQQSVGVANSSWLIDGKKQNTSSLPGITNATMTWETVETWDIGLDFGVFNNRLTGSFDWFSRTTKDMIGPAPILGSVLGTNAPATNNCDMRSTGWELEIGWKDQIGEVKYGARFNISDSKSKILSYPYDGEFDAQSINSYYNGKILGEIWGYESAGIANSQDEMDKWLAAGNKPNWGSNWSAGDIMYKNIDGKEGVNSGASTLADHGDLKRLGNNTARYRVGLNLDASWKGFDFSVFFQGVLKRDWAFGSDDPYFWGAQGNMWQSAVFEEHLDYWREDNQGAYYPKPYFGGINKNHQTQDRYLQDASYIRCKNIQLGYTLPASILAPAGISNCRVYVSCDNLFTLTSLSSVYDPEALNGYGWFTSGKTYPLQRTLAFGVNLSF